MLERDKILTSVRIEPEMYNEFRVICLRYKFSLRKLVERSMYAYINDEEFRRQIHRINLNKKS